MDWPAGAEPDVAELEIVGFPEGDDEDEDDDEPEKRQMLATHLASIIGQVPWVRPRGRCPDRHQTGPPRPVGIAPSPDRGALNEKGVGFRVLDDPSLDTTTRTDKLVFGILASIAEFETALRRERQLEGIAKAKEEGRTGGRPALITDDVRATIVRLKGEDNSVRQIAAIRKSFDINIEAMLFGRAIRLRGLATAVTPDTLCASACALIWLAGTPRSSSACSSMERPALTQRLPLDAISPSAGPPGRIRDDRAPEIR